MTFRTPDSAAGGLRRRPRTGAYREVLVVPPDDNRHDWFVCTVVLSLEPGARVPLLLLGVRDELTDRPWRPPARHWAGSPLVGGLDEQAGGTWLAVEPDVPRVACLLNGRGQAADLAVRRSRGALPLRAAAEGTSALRELAGDPGALAAYDPFHLICATAGSASVLSWPGKGAPLPGPRPAVRALGPGTHLFTNAGHAYPPDPAYPDDPSAEPKAARFAAKFAGGRPSGDPALPIAQAWGDWLTLARGDGLDHADPAAIIARRDLPDGRVWGSTSVTLIGLAPGAVRYDFQPHPGEEDGWYPVTVSLRRDLCGYGAPMPKPRNPRIIAVAAGIAACAAAGLAAAVPAVSAPAASRPAAGQAASAARVPQVTVTPDAIRIPGDAMQGPPTTALCEQADGIACYQPGQLRAAYHLPALYARGITGKGSTIMIVDSFGSPAIRRDLTVFDGQFRYPAPPSFKIIAPLGKPRFNPDNPDMTSWAGETTLDVEYAHALAPRANILLVETPVSETEGVTGFPQIVRAEQYAMAHYKVDVISQSFGATEQTFASYAQLRPLRAAYLEAYRRHVTVLAASGDAGATDFTLDGVDYYTRRVASWPDSDPLVTAVGGTRLERHGAAYTPVAWNDTYDNAWNLYASGSTQPVPAASGGGKSEFFARPSYQNGVKAVTGARRGVPDIAMSAACDGSAVVYSSYLPGQAGWSLTCGTSEATPEFAAIVALADQVARHPLGLINPRLYALLARHAPGLVDVTSGSNTVSFYQGATRPYRVAGYPARKGYDLVTGVGTVNASQFVYELAAVPGH